MPKFDITKLNVAIDKLLETTENPRHRFLLQSYSRHRYLEVAGRYEEIFVPEMMSTDPPLNKLTVSPRNNLKPNADGSVTLYFQNESPGKDKEANWLPAPKGEFIPMLRMYWPKDAPPSIIDGSWKPPAVQQPQ